MNNIVPGNLNRIREGKVRSIYEIDPESLLIVTSDRISAFDVVLPSAIPGKGIVLTQISNFWFDQIQSICANHIISTNFNDFPEHIQSFRSQLRGRSIVVKKVDIIPYECIVRGYISGSMWKAYKNGERISEDVLPFNLKESDKLPEPLFTPTTKAEEGHDMPVTRKEMTQAIGNDTARFLEDKSKEIYGYATDFAEKRGIIIADTKFEFGLVQDKIVLADEVLTPDSSRFWPKSDYAPGSSQKSYDKQFVRDYLETLDWDKTPPGPTLPASIVEATIQKYQEAFQRLTGRTLSMTADGTWEDEE
jgi:phosphoribosylaminoimidazole-succinocarboxamide synthase